MIDKKNRAENPEKEKRFSREGLHLVYETLRGIIADTFYILLSAYFVLLLIESVSEGFVSFYFNLNYLLLITAVCGILYALAGGEERGISAVGKPTFVDGVVIAALGILSALIIWHKTAYTGTGAVLLSIGAGAFMAFILFAVDQPEEK
jgi:hypothetical protein